MREYLKAIENIQNCPTNWPSHVTADILIVHQRFNVHGHSAAVWRQKFLQLLTFSQQTKACAFAGCDVNVVLFLRKEWGAQRELRTSTAACFGVIIMSYAIGHEGICGCSYLVLLTRYEQMITKKIWNIYSFLNLSRMNASSNVTSHNVEEHNQWLLMAVDKTLFKTITSSCSSYLVVLWF